MVSDPDLINLDGARWRLIDVERWNEILGGFATDLSEPFLAYRQAVANEADDVHRARQAVRDRQPVTWGREPELLGQWAFFERVLDGLTPNAEWERKKLISGPLVTHFLAFAWDYPGLGERDAGVFVEFMAERARRSLCVKVYDNGSPGRLRRLQGSFAELLKDDRFVFARPPSKSNDTCTVARLVLPLDADATDVRRELVELEDLLRLQAEDAFRKALVMR